MPLASPRAEVAIIVVCGLLGGCTGSRTLHWRLDWSAAPARDDTILLISLRPDCASSDVLQSWTTSRDAASTVRLPASGGALVVRAADASCEVYAAGCERLQADSADPITIAMRPSTGAASCEADACCSVVDAGLPGPEAGADSGIDAALCTATFGDAPFYELCGIGPDGCEFYVRFDAPEPSCNAVCTNRGGTCVAAYDNVAMTTCERAVLGSCADTPFDRLCICAP